MKLIKDIDNIRPEDKLIALRIINQLKMGNRVFGSPAEGLKKTLKRLEDERNKRLQNKNALDYLDNDEDLLDQINLLKAGIKGEEELAQFFERIIKYDETLQDIIVFASLSDPGQNHGDQEGYISDSDFIAVYGNNILILDAKNINTHPDFPIYVSEGALVGVGGKPILELHPSIYIWKNIFDKEGIYCNSIHGYTVIINKKGATIWKNQEWYISESRPIHIANLVDCLRDWIKDKKPEVNLSLLVLLAKMQIKKETSNIDLRSKMGRFGI